MASVFKVRKWPTFTKKARGTRKKMISLAYCEELCLKITRNEIDNFEIISEGSKFGFLRFL